MGNFFKLLLFSFFALFLLPTPLGPLAYLAIAGFAFKAALDEMKKGNPEIAVAPQSKSYIPSTTNAPVNAPIKTPANMPKDVKCPSCGASVKITAKKCEYCGSTLKPEMELPEPAKLASLEVGQGISVRHPVAGSLSLQIRGRILFGELWQTATRPDVPWTPTGSYYAGFTLSNGAYLLNWQERFFLLDKSRPLTDQEINRDFLPYARQFGASNQTANVVFNYLGGRWKIDDIGKFQVEYAEGENTHLAQGASGRFIHASGDNAVLVVEDFQSGGGGRDMLWTGYIIQETDIQF